MLERHSARTAERTGGSKTVERLPAEAAHRIAGRFETARRDLRFVLAAARHHAAPHDEFGVRARMASAPPPAVAREDDAERAVSLARGSDRLRTMRSGLRERVLAAPPADHVRLAAAVGAAFRTMGRRGIDAGHPA